jgi:hypothetical protein
VDEDMDGALDIRRVESRWRELEYLQGKPRHIHEEFGKNLVIFAGWLTFHQEE